MELKIGVFAGNGTGVVKDSKFFQIAYQTGKLLAENKYILVSGGGPGMMNESIRGAFEAGGHTIGAVLDRADRQNSEFIKEKYKFLSLKPRQQKIIELSDGFIALPGGIGTLYEIAEIIALKKLREIDPDAPLIIIDEYFDKLKDYFKHMTKEGFTDESLYDAAVFADKPQSAVELLNSYYGRNNT